MERRAFRKGVSYGCRGHEFHNPNIAVFNTNLVQRIATDLRIRTRFLMSSELHLDQRLTGQDRVLEICRRVGASQYVNPIGGTQLYQSFEFARQAIKLSFLQTSISPACHSVGQRAAPYLSIIDTLMLNDETSLSRLMSKYRLLTV